MAAGLLHRAAVGFAAAQRLVPGLRMVLVAGSRIDPATLRGAGRAGRGQGGPEVRGFLPDLYKHLAVCDLAVTAGGLATTMELAACRRPFLYMPLRRHFEQNLHVRQRLAQYQAGRCLDWDQTGPDELAGGDRHRDRPRGQRPAGGDLRRGPGRGQSRGTALTSPFPCDGQVPSRLLSRV